MAVFILMFMMEGIKGKRVINQVLETHREVCFAKTETVQVDIRKSF